MKLTKDNIKKTSGKYKPKAIIILIDELTEVMTDSNFKLVSNIQNNMGSIARLGRAAAVHLCLATQRPSSNVINADLNNNIHLKCLLGDFDSSASTLIFDKDVSHLSKGEIKGRGFLKSGKEIYEFQSYYTTKENDFELKDVFKESKESNTDNTSQEDSKNTKKSKKNKKSKTTKESKRNETKSIESEDTPMEETIAENGNNNDSKILENENIKNDTANEGMTESKSKPQTKDFPLNEIDEININNFQEERRKRLEELRKERVQRRKESTIDRIGKEIVEKQEFVRDNGKESQKSVSLKLNRKVNTKEIVSNDILGGSIESFETKKLNLKFDKDLIKRQNEENELKMAQKQKNDFLFDDSNILSDDTESLQ